jgi:hypothetical protein
MKIIVHSNHLGMSPESYWLSPGTIAGCFGSYVWYYVSRWEWTPDREHATVLDQAEAETVLTDARIRYEQVKSYQPMKIEFTVVER